MTYVSTVTCEANWNWNVEGWSVMSHLVYADMLLGLYSNSIVGLYS